MSVCRLTYHEALGGSYQEAVQTEPVFPRFASNTANTLCSDTEPCVKLTGPGGKYERLRLQVTFAAQESFLLISYLQ